MERVIPRVIDKPRYSFQDVHFVQDAWPEFEVEDVSLEVPLSNGKVLSAPVLVANSPHCTIFGGESPYLIQPDHIEGALKAGSEYLVFSSSDPKEIKDAVNSLRELEGLIQEKNPYIILGKITNFTQFLQIQDWADDLMSASLVCSSLYSSEGGFTAIEEMDSAKKNGLQLVMSGFRSPYYKVETCFKSLVAGIDFLISPKPLHPNLSFKEFLHRQNFQCLEDFKLCGTVIAKRP